MVGLLAANEELATWLTQLGNHSTDLPELRDPERRRK